MTDDTTDKEAAKILARASMTHPPFPPISSLSWTPRTEMPSGPSQPAAEPEMHEPLPVPGYRAQGASPIATVTRFKEEEERILRLLDEMRESYVIDKRWLAIGRTQLEQAFMAINRSVFKPARVELPGDDGEVAATGREIADAEIQADVDRDEWFDEIGGGDPEEPLTEEEAEAFDHALRKDD